MAGKRINRRRDLGSSMKKNKRRKRRERTGDIPGTRCQGAASHSDMRISKSKIYRSKKSSKH